MLHKIRSNYILRHISSYLNPKIYLLLYKYNKKLKKKLELTKKDFKAYNQIEIEIIPTELIKDKKNTIINYFVEEKEYYHLFIDDKELKRRNYFKRKENVKKIKVLIDMEIKSLMRLFLGCKYIKEINFVKFNRNNIENMNYLFCDCSNLININLSKMRTDNVKSMKSMFANCNNLKELNLSNFNTSKVERMDEMFSGCGVLDLDLSSFNTSNVTDMQRMFFGCCQLINLNISSFNTSKVNEMSYMFCNCVKLKSLNVSSFITVRVFTMIYMFGYCYSLTDLDISNFYIDDNTYVKNMFSRCSIALKYKIKSQKNKLKSEAFH